MKWIVIQPLGGLGNRLRVIASALIAAETQERGVLLVWKKNPCCKGDYAELFAPSPLFKVVSPSMTRLTERLRRRTGIAPPSFLLPLSSGFGRKVYDVDTGKLTNLRFRVPPAELAAHPVVFFDDLCLDFMPGGMSTEVYDEKVKGILTQFRLAAPIARRLFDIPPPSIGVHIRHGADSPDAVRISSLERFIDAMEWCLAKDPRTKFFLATDRSDIEAELRNRFGDRILSSPKASYGRDIAGIHDALVDLFMLSRCDRVLGSYWSSFSEYAALIGGIDLEIVGVGPWAGPGRAILTRADKYDKYGTEGWKQGWSPEGPPPGWSPERPPVSAS